MPRLTIESPIGPLTLTEKDGAISALDWDRAAAHDDTPLLREAAAQLAAYFGGALKEFSLPLAPEGTAFQQDVWKALCDIPAGGIKTYGELAAALGTSPRPAGTACGKNPIPIIIPCHRVIGADGRLGGYSGHGGIKTKAFLLRHEGALLLDAA